MAAATAAVLTPAVSALARRMPRGAAIAIVVLVSLGVAGGVVYGLVGDVVAQLRVLQDEAPRLAQELERSGRFAEAAREAELAERVETIVDRVPERLRGGSPAEAVRSATTRGLAFLAVTVLTIFLVLHGPRLLGAAGRQIHDEAMRERVASITAAVERRAVGYARGTALTAALAGGFAFVVARMAGVPGPAPLAVWVALWDVVPVIGAAVGALPIVVLAALVSPARGLVLAIAFVTWQVVEQFALQRPIERRTVRVGPFLTVVAGFAGIELYGIAGALLAILAMAVVLVVVEELVGAGAEVAAQGDRVPETHGDE